MEQHRRIFFGRILPTNLADRRTFENRRRLGSASSPSLIICHTPLSTIGDRALAVLRRCYGWLHPPMMCLRSDTVISKTLIVFAYLHTYTLKPEKKIPSIYLTENCFSNCLYYTRNDNILTVLSTQCNTYTSTLLCCLHVTCWWISQEWTFNDNIYADNEEKSSSVDAGDHKSDWQHWRCSNYSPRP